MPLAEIVLSIIYSEGVAKGRITLTKIAELFCENPAKCFGLYSRPVFGQFLERKKADHGAQ